MKFKNANKYILNRMILVGIIGLLIGSFLDLQISHLLYFRKGIIGRAIRLSGEMPMIILAMSLSMEILIRNIKKYQSEKELDSLMVFLSLIALILPAYVSSKGIPKYFVNPIANLRTYILIFYLITSLLFREIFKEIPNHELYEYFKFYFLVVVFTMLAMNLLKNIWSRARFYPMKEKNNYANFSFWLIPQLRNNVTDAFKSFPSGHTTSASAVLALLYLPKLKNQKIVDSIKFFSISWPLLVAIARILDGAHYLTDVSFAILMTVLLIKISYKLIFKAKKEEDI